MADPETIEWLRVRFENLARPRHFNLARPMIGRYMEDGTEFIWQFFQEGYRVSGERNGGKDV